MTLAWLEFKSDLAAFADLDRDALHIYAAVLIQLGVALVSRRPLSHWLPWSTVAAAALLNEAADVYSDVWPDHALQAGKAIHDLVNTMVMPTLLLVLSRRRSPARVPDDPDS